MVPDAYTFFDLHCAIQDAMGWTDSHLHAFYITKGKERLTIEFPNPDVEDFGFGEKPLDDRKEHIVNYFGITVKQCIYSYDFGDGWDHTVVVERELKKKPGAKYTKCIAGENACPPEDCGGVWGYADLQKVVKDPRNKAHADVLHWLGIKNSDDFDPHAFDPTTVEFQDPKKRLREWNKGFGIS